MGLKDIYYAWEDKYYRFLDKLDQSIPVYKIVEPIDRIMPSFVLFLILVLLLILGTAGFAWTLINSDNAQLTVLVLDESRRPVENAYVTLGFEGTTNPFRTDAGGRIPSQKFKLNSEVELGVSVQGYKLVSQAIIVDRLDTLATVELEKESPGATRTTKRTILIKDATGNRITEAVSISFECTNPDAIPPDSITVVNGSAEVQEPSDCGELLATAESYSFEPQHGVPLSKITNTILLQEKEISGGQGTIDVELLNSQGNFISSTVEVSIFTDDGYDGVPVDTKDAIGGTASFDVSPGTYFARTSSTANYASKTSQSVSVQANGRETITITLQSGGGGGGTLSGLHTIRIKTVDKDNGSGISGAIATLFRDGREIETKTTSSTDFNAVFSVEEDTPYDMTIDHAGYCPQRLSGIVPNNTLRIVEMERFIPGNSSCGAQLQVQVLSDEGKKIRNATVKLYTEEGFSLGYAQKTTDVNGIAEFIAPTGTYKAFAFKGSTAGWSDPVKFVQNAYEKQRLVVTLQIPDGTIEVHVKDKDGQPIQFADVTFYDPVFREVVGGGSRPVESPDGILTYTTKADKSVYAVVSKEGYGSYTTIVYDIQPNSATVIDATLEPEEISGDVQIELAGLYKGADLATVLTEGEEYTAKFKLHIPRQDNTRNYRRVGVHVRTGNTNRIETDQLLIKKLNLPANPAVIKSVSYNPPDNYAQDSQIQETLDEAKWFNAEWQSFQSGIIEFTADIKVKKTAGVSDELNIFYRAWAITQDNRWKRDPLDTGLGESENAGGKQGLYANAKTETRQVGTETLCNDRFCFSGSILDRKEDILTTVNNDFTAKIFNPYVFNFTIQNNSGNDVDTFPQATMKIQNPEEKMDLGAYTVYGSQNGKKSGDVNAFETAWINVQDFKPGDAISTTLNFSPQAPGSQTIKILLRSGQRIRYEKNISITVDPAKEFDVQIRPDLLASGVQNEITVSVKDKNTKLEVENAAVKIKDRFNSTLLQADTTVKGIAQIQLPSQMPGEKLKLFVEKEEYKTFETALNVNDKIAELSPDTLGLTLNAQTRPDNTAVFDITNRTEFNLKVRQFELQGDLRGYISEDQVSQWLETFKGETIKANDKSSFTLRANLSDLGRRVSQATNLSGTLIATLEGLDEEWSFELPVKISIGVGGEADTPTCFTISKKEWKTSTEGSPVQVSVTLQNNCTVASTPIPLEQIQAKIDWQSNSIGTFELRSEQFTKELRDGYYRTILARMEPEESQTLTLVFTPDAGTSGSAKATIEFQAGNKTDSGSQTLNDKMTVEIAAVNFKDCVRIDKGIVNMKKGESGEFNIETLGCGQATQFKLQSKLNLSESNFQLGEKETKAIQILAENNNPGQYPVFVNATPFGQTEERLLKMVRARIAPDGCFELSKYEFDVYDDPTNQFDGYDTAQLLNKCSEKKVEITSRTKDFGKALMEGLKTGLLMMALGAIGQYYGASKKEIKPLTQQEMQAVVTATGVIYIDPNDPATGYPRIRAAAELTPQQGTAITQIQKDKISWRGGNVSISSGRGFSADKEWPDWKIDSVAGPNQNGQYSIVISKDRQSKFENIDEVKVDEITLTVPMTAIINKKAQEIIKTVKIAGEIKSLKAPEGFKIRLLSEPPFKPNDEIKFVAEYNETIHGADREIEWLRNGEVVPITTRNGETYTGTAPKPGDYMIQARLKATDTQGEVVSNTIIVHVIDPDQLGEARILSPNGRPLELLTSNKTNEINVSKAGEITFIGEIDNPDKVTEYDWDSGSLKSTTDWTVTKENDIPAFTIKVFDIKKLPNEFQLKFIARNKALNLESTAEAKIKFIMSESKAEGGSGFEIISGGQTINNTHTIELQVGQTKALQAENCESIAWRTQEASIAEVSPTSGKTTTITAIAIGDTTITANCNGNIITLKVKVIAGQTQEPGAGTGMKEITVTAQPNGNAATVSWTLVEGASRYVIKEEYHSLADRSLGSTVDATVFDELSPGNYRFLVQAADSSGKIIGQGESEEISISSGQAPAATKPKKVAGITVDEGDAKITLTWEAVAGATGYKIYFGFTAEPDTTPYVLAETVQIAEFLHQGLANAKTYFYYIVAFNTSGDGPRSTVVTGTPKPAPGAEGTGTVDLSKTFVGWSGTQEPVPNQPGKTKDVDSFLATNWYKYVTYRTSNQTVLARFRITVDNTVQYSTSKENWGAGATTLNDSQPHSVGNITVTPDTVRAAFLKNATTGLVAKTASNNCPYRYTSPNTGFCFVSYKYSYKDTSKNYAERYTIRHRGSTQDTAVYKSKSLESSGTNIFEVTGLEALKVKCDSGDSDACTQWTSQSASLSEDISHSSIAGLAQGSDVSPSTGLVTAPLTGYDLFGQQGTLFGGGPQMGSGQYPTFAENPMGYILTGGGALGGQGGLPQLMTSVLIGAGSAILGKPNPYSYGMYGLIFGTWMAYNNQDDVKFTIIAKDALVGEIKLLMTGEKIEPATGAGTATIAEEESKDIVLQILDTNSSIPRQDDPLLANYLQDLAFINSKGIKQADPTVPFFRLLKVQARRQQFETEGYKGKREPDQPKANEKKTTEDRNKILEKFHLQFNSFDPKECGPNTFPCPAVTLNNCQLGARIGSTGKEALPAIGLAKGIGWSWSSVKENSCDASNPDGIYCDATQFSIALLKKLQDFRDFVEANRPFECASPESVSSIREQSLSEIDADAGITRTQVRKLGNNTGEVVVTVSNSNAQAVQAKVKTTVKAADGSVVKECEEDVSVQTKSSTSCIVDGLRQGQYQIDANATVALCADCKNAEKANDHLNSDFAWGFSGLQDCGDYSTKKFSDYVVATELERGKLPGSEKALKDLRFEASIMRDGFTQDFQKDFDEFAKTKSFFATPSYYTENDGLGELFGDTNRFKFIVPGQAIGFAEAGKYLVEMNIKFNNENWDFYRDGKPDVFIEVKLTREAAPNPESPFYYLPFDGRVGLDSANGRQGYGVNFRQESEKSIKINADSSQPVFATNSPTSLPVPNGWILASFNNDFRTLNQTERGIVLSVSTQGETTKLDYSPSFATPVLLRVSSPVAESAYAFYGVDIGGTPFGTSTYLSEWTGVGGACRDFDDALAAERFYNARDRQALEKQCARVLGDAVSTSYGFEWCSPKRASTSVGLSTVIFTPQNVSSRIYITSASQSASLSTADEAGDKVALVGVSGMANNSPGSGINTLQDVFNLVNDGALCVDGSSSRAFSAFFWNPKPILENMQGQMNAAEAACTQTEPKTGPRELP